MPRPPRIDFPNALYHVISRGNGRQRIFWTAVDRERFLAQLADGLHTSGVVLYALVETDNHFHRSVFCCARARATLLPVACAETKLELAVLS